MHTTLGVFQTLATLTILEEIGTLLQKKLRSEIRLRFRQL